MQITLKQLHLENNLDRELYQTYLDALNKFLALISYEDIDAIILCGSFAKEKLQLDSDIDLVIIGNQKFKDTVIDGIEIGIISYKKEKLLEEIRKEKVSFIRRLSSLVGNGISLHGEEIGEDIISLGKKTYVNKVPSLDSDELDKISHFIERNRILSADYISRHDDFAFYSRMSFSIQQTTQNYFKLIGQPIPDWKRTFQDIKDKDFQNALIGFFEGENKHDKYKHFLVTLDILEKLISKY